ncbi:MAG: hypothetical protein HC904_15500 [Blastochloris sp.]|nr:hypothetical protein [Blastochloris sp.]
MSNLPPSLHIVASVNPSVGGPAQSVPMLLNSLLNSGATTRLLCLNYAEHGPLPHLTSGTLEALDPNPLTRLLRGWSPALAKKFTPNQPKSPSSTTTASGCSPTITQPKPQRDIGKNTSSLPVVC